MNILFLERYLTENRFLLFAITCMHTCEKTTYNHSKKKYILSRAKLYCGRIQRRCTLSHIKYATYKYDANSKLDIPTRRL